MYRVIPVPWGEKDVQIEKDRKDTKQISLADEIYILLFIQ